MSYLSVPRIHFFGEFLASPSTINNLPSNFDPNNPIPNYPPDVPAGGNALWNPMGVARYALNGQNVNGHSLSGVFVKSVMPDSGDLVTEGDPIIGAQVMTTTSGSPGKIVDLDPDQQGITQLFGLQLQLRIASEGNAGFTMKGGEYLEVPNLTDLWFSRGPCGMFETIIKPDQINWNNVAASPLLTKFKEACKNGISVKFTMDQYNGFSSKVTDPNFNIGRISGAMGPAEVGEPTRCSVGRKFIPVGPSRNYQSGYVQIDNTRNKAIIDLSNSTLQTQGKSNAPFPKALNAAVVVNGKPNYFENKKNIVENFESVYKNAAGIVEVDINKTETKALTSNPVAIYDPNAQNPDAPVLQEANTYVNLSQYFMRLPAPVDEKGSELSVQMIARQWGKPISDTLNLEFVNGSPQEGISISKSVKIGADGLGTLTVKWEDIKEKDLKGDRAFIGSQIYFIGGAWQNTSNLNWSGAGLSVIAWPGINVPDNPTWTKNVKPIMDEFMHVYPGMKKIMDMSDYDTVKQNSPQLKMVFTLPETHPHAMPVSRDLNPTHKTIIVKWIDQGCVFD